MGGVGVGVVGLVGVGAKASARASFSVHRAVTEAHRHVG